MLSDSQIKSSVEAELRWDPDIKSDDIAVSVKDGVVTLAGFVHSYGEKLSAESDAKRVAGVTGVANDIEVRLPVGDKRPDPEIVRDATAALKMHLPLSSSKIKVVGKDGWLTLEGDVEWNYQKTRAAEAVRDVKGVRGVSNLIHIKPRAAPTDVKKQIEEAFRRSAEVDANRITVEVDGGKVTLRGTVRSWSERKEAERAAWRAPGVTNVSNLINVRSDMLEAA
jgi:osmotically-inducible protein OsmY